MIKDANLWRFRIVVVMAAVGVMLLVGAVASAEPLTIVRVTPQGEDVPVGRQIVVAFDRPMVALGRMARQADEIPIDIQPGLRCRWRWLNTSTLACQLDEADALRPATRYTVTVAPEFRALDRAVLKEPHTFSFLTARPAVRFADFITWKSPGWPVMRLRFNQPIHRASVGEHVYLTVEGQTGRYSLDVTPDMREAAGEAGASAGDESAEKNTAPQDAETATVWRILPEIELPMDADVQLKVEPGLASSQGPEPGAEHRTVVAFRTFPAFRFMSVTGFDTQGREVRIDSGADAAPAVRLDPYGPVALNFSSPVMDEAVRDNIRILPDLSGGRPDYDPWAGRHGYSWLNGPHRKDTEYSVWLPVPLAPWQIYRFQSTQTVLRDEFGRPLPTPMNMEIRTDHRRPDAELIYPTAVLEKGVKTDLPLTVINLERVRVRGERFTAGKNLSRATWEVAVPEEIDAAFRLPLGVREALDGVSGVVYGVVETRPKLNKHPSERRFFAQITPFQVHVKLGHLNTLAWVTDLQSGLPVNGAEVELYADTVTQPTADPQVVSRAVTDARGVARLPGTAALDPSLEKFNWCREDKHCPRWMVRVVKDGDMALLPLDYRFEIDTYRASGYTAGAYLQQRYQHLKTWGTTAQGIYRAGDTIQYKIYVRHQDNRGFIPPPRRGYHLTIVDPAGKTLEDIEDIELSDFGAFHGEVTVPGTGAVGYYRFYLGADFVKDWERMPLQVLVSDFTPAAFRVRNSLNGERFRLDDRVTVDTLASLHGGGPYGGADVRVTAFVQARPFAPATQTGKGFYVDTTVRGPRRTAVLHQSSDLLNDRGEYRVQFPVTDTGIVYGRMTVESAVMDDRGKYVATVSSTPVAARDRYVGLRHTRWVYAAGQPAPVEVLVMDDAGRPVAGQTVEITADRRDTIAARVKGAGNAYLTRYNHEWTQVFQGRLVSQNTPVTTEFTPGTAGIYRMTATVTDTRGRDHTTRLTLWVTGRETVLWEGPEDNSLGLVSEKDNWRVGETARFLVKNPFPGAWALITKERLGVMQHWVHPLEGSTPVIDVPVEMDDVPGFYLSVTLMSPRTDKPLSADNVDLGKPAFRMGYARVEVKDPAKEIRVRVKPQRDRYKPGDTVHVELEAFQPEGATRGPVELAVAVLDEAVFDLLPKGRDQYDPYKGFYTLDSLDLKNFGLLTRIVGRQKFEKKGANPGGGGPGEGPDISMRNRFDFVAYWNPSLSTDALGKAGIDFKTPDNLTGWRILVLAVTPRDTMGLGEAGIKVNRPTEIRPVLPNQVTEGDRFQAGFSIMNRTDTRRRLTARIRVTGPLKSEGGTETIEKILDLNPWERKTFYAPVETEGSGRLAFEVRAFDDRDGDALAVRLPVLGRRSLETSAVHGSVTTDRVQVPIAFPEDMRVDTGGLRLTLSPSLLTNLDGAFRYIRDYAYDCWEQKLGRAVMAVHYLHLKAYLSPDLAWPEAESMADRLLSQAADYQAGNGGMCYFEARDDRVDPYLSAYTALAFQWLKQAGQSVSPQVEARLAEYLDRLLRRDVLPDFYSAGMAATTRAVALAAGAAAGRVGKDDLYRYRPHLPRMSLFGKALYLQAAVTVEGGEAAAREALDAILAHADQSSGTLTFNERVETGEQRILSSDNRTQAAILSALVKLAKHETYGQGASVQPEMTAGLARSLLQARGSRDAWYNTQENVFCTQALAAFARAYESGQPNITVTAYLEEDPLGRARFTHMRQPPAIFDRSFTSHDPGRKTRLMLDREGNGRIYYALQMAYAPRTEGGEAVNAGMDVHRTYRVKRDEGWVRLDSPMAVRQGDVVRVDLFLSLPAPRYYVAVNDPVPGGLEPVQRDLATASVMDTVGLIDEDAGGFLGTARENGIEYQDASRVFYHQALRHDSARFFAEYVPAGNYHLAYAAQTVAPGSFQVPPVHAEEMYDPDVYGKGRSAQLIVTGQEAESEGNP